MAPVNRVDEVIAGLLQPGRPIVRVALPHDENGVLMSARTFAYWATTAITVFVLLSGGLAYLLRADFAVGGVTALGYPTHVVTILGVWKLLAVPADPDGYLWKVATPG